MFATILALSFVLNADLDKAIEYSRNGDHEASELILSKYKGKEPSYHFYRLVNAFKLNDKEAGIPHADALIYRFGLHDVPQRYIDLAIIMKAEMETWNNTSDDLDDISREMTKITDRLKNSKGGPETQKIQKSVLDRLAKMIKDQEDKQNADQNQSQGQDSKDKEGKQKTSPQPATDTIRPNESGSGLVDQKKVKEIADVWGKLPEKERAKALTELTRNMPAKDKAVIEAYFRELHRKSIKR